jgi:hypothetical protein
VLVSVGVIITFGVAVIGWLTGAMKNNPISKHTIIRRGRTSRGRIDLWAIFMITFLADRSCHANY